MCNLPFLNTLSIQYSRQSNFIFVVLLPDYIMQAKQDVLCKEYQRNMCKGNLTLVCTIYQKNDIMILNN